MAKKSNVFTRRQLLKSLGAMGGLAALGPLGQGVFMRQAMAAAPTFSDYKAMVCIFMYGGNDSYNMLVPSGSGAGTGYSDYAAARGSFSVSNTPLSHGDLNSSNLSSGAGNPYNVDLRHSTAYLKGYYDLAAKGIDLGVNAVMPELSQLISDDKASVISNVGTLVRPVTRGEILADTAELPLFLFAHNHQQRALQTGQADNLNSTGWAGRIADNWAGINNGSRLGLNISYSGNDRMLIGDTTSPLALSAGGIPVMTMQEADKGDDHQDRRALYKALSGEQNSSSSGKVSFDASNTFDTSDPFMSVYNSMLNNTMATFDELKLAWDATPVSYTTTGPYGEALFGIPDATTLGFGQGIGGHLIRQLESVAKMVHLGASGLLGSGYNRQVFFVVLGGFDTHADQLNAHPRLLREMSLGLWKFQKAMEELTHANKVTTFTMSDFGRTITNNGNGTDHAWGAHHLVMGGDGVGSAGNLAGGQLVGNLPDMRLAGADDYSYSGRTIPTLGQDQLNATLCDWFGVDTTLMPTLFPNLPNFQSSATLESAYLNSLFT